jgi:hypothetical protein
MFWWEKKIAFSFSSNHIFLLNNYLIYLAKIVSIYLKIISSIHNISKYSSVYKMFTKQKLCSAARDTTCACIGLYLSLQSCNHE